MSQDKFSSTTQLPGVGSSCTVNKLWEGRSSSDRIIWLEERPEIKEEEKSIPKATEHAITLLHRDLQRIGDHRLDAIVMRGSVLEKFLTDTIPNASTFYNEAEHGIAIRRPFRPLFWHLDQINAAAASQDRDLSEAATLLQSVLEDEFSGLLAKRDALVLRQEINFDTIWTLFKPGITCLTEYANDVVAVKASSIEHSRDAQGHMYYRVRYDVLGWDGQYFGWQDSYTDILEFLGRQKIKDLDIYPMHFHDDQNIMEHLVLRGKKFISLAIKEPYMMRFSGEALDRETSPMWWQGEQKKKMSERVVIDARAYDHYAKRLFTSKWRKREEINEALSKEGGDQSIFMYCCPELYCYALQRKKWIRVWIDDLEEVVFNDAAYPSLVLPNEYKELLLAFAEAQIHGSGFDDVIAGKGQGILMLLAGPPGTGKTLTAESVAEHMKRPLYSVSAGELGASAGGMESELDRVLMLSTRWNAVLLLDEADVFLEKRTDNDLQRNTIVSIFLKKLEYYRGIMFLTTNRHHSFDEAFKSRIHIAIRYPDLDTNARRTVWQNFLKRAENVYQQGVSISEIEMDEIAQKKLNGREIRNIVKSAQLLASRSRGPLRRSHLEIVWKIEHEDSAWRSVDGENICSGVMKGEH